MYSLLGLKTSPFIGNFIVPLSSVPFGAMRVTFPEKDLFWRAPIITFIFMPSFIFPAWASSIFPSKMSEFRSAMEQMVVPALKELASITWFPIFTGTSRTVPLALERICVVAMLCSSGVAPVLAICKFFCAVENCCWAFFTFCSAL